ncbi:tetratricopeptide repeat protein [Costertonia aggregata]|uniref:Tetratricopeptide repeat protein n=1 Tax=Costertonia aggregata TaxID=343403 RepID=A0A7H9AL01_9FLAO|nr:hypothetical protein [Costertonia aggregata]QLG44014.1 hypothetical protein HYG79_01155 [Costertonia aggregata]
MKNLVLVVFFLSTISISAQDQYTKGMQKAFGFWQEGNLAEAANMFERISNAEMDNWLPYYYVSSINTILSFGEKDKEKLTQQLTKAQEFLDVAKGISPNNPEILVQQAMIHTAWIAFDGATYGMSLSGKVAALYQKALELAPDNPRVVFSKAEWDMGSAKYFGQDTSPYCKDVERSLELFATFKAASDFHPNWGEDRAKEIAENCN